METILTCIVPFAPKPFTRNWNLACDYLRSHLNQQFVYFIEDNFDTYDVMAANHKSYCWSQRGEMVIVRNR
jgi:hypothetical protein